MSKFRPTVVERIEAFRADPKKRQELSIALAHPTVQEALDLLRELYSPSPSPKPANDTTPLALALCHQYLGGGHGILRDLHVFVDPPSKSDPQLGYPELLEEGDDVPCAKRKKRA